MSYRHYIIGLKLDEAKAFYGCKDEQFLQKAIAEYRSDAPSIHSEFADEDIATITDFVYGNRSADEIEGESIFREFFVNTVLQEVADIVPAPVDEWSPVFYEFYENVAGHLDDTSRKHIDLLNDRAVFGGDSAAIDQPYGYLTNAEAAVLMQSLEKIQDQYHPGDFGKGLYEWLKHVTEKGLDVFSYSG